MAILCARRHKRALSYIHSGLTSFLVIMVILRRLGMFACHAQNLADSANKNVHTNIRIDGVSTGHIAI
jgi:hypothetical protein